VITSVRALLLVLTAALASSVGTGQPAPRPVLLDGVRPYYTAFPDIKPPLMYTLVQNADGTTTVTDKQSASVRLPAFPTVGNDAPAIRRVQYEQIQEGVAFLARLKEVARLGAQDPRDVRAVGVAAEVYAIAAELEADPAKRLLWFEARVRILKEGEETIHANVLRGSMSPSALHLARFERLRAETDLLRLQAEIKKAPK
jgi:hypothetical protein